HKLALMLLWLLPILYKLYQNPISGYSKAPWGLSVLSRVTCIFTGSIISPGLSLRQCPNRYTIRAGRNLPDKEFRYLSTVVVTAALYWGVGSTRPSESGEPRPVALHRRGGGGPCTSPRRLAATSVFAKQSLGRIRCRPRRHTP